MNVKTNLKIVIGLAVFAMIVSLYLTYAHYGTTEAFCPAPKEGGPPSCDIVNQSKYAEILGIPIAILGFLGYLAVFLVAVVKLKEAKLKNKFLKTHAKYAHKYIFVLALLGFLFTIWLNYVQIFLLKTICFLCELSAASITIIFIMSIINLRLRK